MLRGMVPLVRQALRRLRPGIGALALLTGAGPLAAQDTTAVALEVRLTPGHDPVVRTRNLLEDTPWLSALREGLPVRLQYRLETWRSREAWPDVLDRTVEWTLVVRHEPLLDQFSITRLGPGNFTQTRRVATPGALADVLGLGYEFRIAPRTAGQYYYTASLEVVTLSESDLDKFERVLRGELQSENGGTSFAERARRLLLRLAGLPRLNLQGRTVGFEVK